MRVLGLPIDTPQSVINRVLGDLGAIARAARRAPAQLDRVLELGEEIAAIGHGVLAVAERLDDRAVQLIELGAQMRELGEHIDARGAEIVERVTRVADTGEELIGVLPALERAIEMATPLEGAIDRFGRLVDRLPGGVRARAAAREPAVAPEPAPPEPAAPTAQPDPTTDP